MLLPPIQHERQGLPERLDNILGRNQEKAGFAFFRFNQSDDLRDAPARSGLFSACFLARFNIFQGNERREKADSRMMPG
jgi:hypothetical protein